MFNTSDDRVTVRDLMNEISHSQTDAHADQWQKPDSDNGRRRAIASAINQHGWSADGIPGILQHILQMVNAGQIAVRSTFNDMPPVNASEVFANPANWYISQQDASEIKALLLPTKTKAVDTKKADVADARRTPHQKGAKWTDEDLQLLLADSESMTQEQLAQFHGVERQRISTLLAQAKDQFETKSSTDLSINPLAKLVKFNNRK